MKKNLLSLAICSITLFSINADYLLKQPVEKDIIKNMILEETPNSYEFTSHTFTNCGKTGYSGPTLSNCTSFYNTNWDENLDYYSNSNGIQIWTVPQTGNYFIKVAGAQGATGLSARDGYGAVLSGDQPRPTFHFGRGFLPIYIIGNLFY